MSGRRRGRGRGPRRGVPVAALVAAAAVSGSTVGAGPARAQVEVDDRVRVRPGPWAPSAVRTPDAEWVEGRVLGVSGDTLLLGVRAAVLRVPLRPPPEVQLRELVDHRAMEGALVGGGMGLVLGAIFAGVDDRQPGAVEDEFPDDEEITTMVLATLAAAGRSVAVYCRLALGGPPGGGSARRAVHGRLAGVRPGLPSSR